MDGTLVDSEKLWDVALYEGAEWLGGSLTETQRLTLIGSNIDATARYLLEVGGLNKPHPEPYLRAARLLGADPARSVAVEDSQLGVESAVAAGCTVLVVPNDVPIGPGERRVLRTSLVGVDSVTLAGLLVSE